MSAPAAHPPPNNPDLLGGFDASRQEFLGSWLLTVPHLTAAEAAHEARATYDAMLQITLLQGGV